MRVRLFLPLLLAGCGGDESARTTNDPVALNVIEASAEGTPAVLAAAVDCSNLPAFVPVHAGARVTSCASGPDGRGRHVSGNIVYLVQAKPQAVLDWSRAHARTAGLAEHQATPVMFTAGEKATRSLRVTVAPAGAETRVAVIWGSPL